MGEREEILKNRSEWLCRTAKLIQLLFYRGYTHHCDRESHEELVALLDAFEAKGGNVLAFTDSHDYPDEMPVFRFDKDSKPYGKEHMEKAEVLPLYRKYNVEKAVAVYADGESFIAEIFPGLRYIAL